MIAQSVQQDAVLNSGASTEGEPHSFSLSAQIRRLEERLSALESSPDRSGHGTHPDAERRDRLIKDIKRTFRDRAARRKFFPTEFVSGEACWDILLDLSASAFEGKRISVTSACLASGVPNTTALRWIALLEHSGLIGREQDEHDRRRTYLRITDRGLTAMMDYFAFVTQDQL
jgi:predicted transcriptional regulator